MSTSGQISLYASGSGFTYTVTVIGWYSKTPLTTGQLHTSPDVDAGAVDVTGGWGVYSVAVRDPRRQRPTLGPGHRPSRRPATGAKTVTIVATMLSVSRFDRRQPRVGEHVVDAEPDGVRRGRGTQSNTSVVPVDADGKIVVKNNTSANRNVFLDVIGWNEPATKTWTYTYNGDGLRMQARPRPTGQ